jgi:hypothetical protein
MAAAHKAYPCDLRVKNTPDSEIKKFIADEERNIAVKRRTAQAGGKLASRYKAEVAKEKKQNALNRRYGGF